MMGLPLLHHYGEREKASEPLKGYVLILIQHLLSDVKDFLKALEVAGADKKRMFIIGIPYSSKEEVVAELKQKYKVYAPTSYPFDEYVEDALRKALEICKRESLSLLIIEDGGYAVPMIHERFRDYIGYCKGAVEQTTNGIWRDEELVLKRGLKFEFPLVSIPDCKLKREIEAPFIGKAVIRNIQILLSKIGQFIEGKKVGIVGYGTIGRKIADEAKNQKAIVSVSEINPVKSLIARLSGFDTKSIPDLVKESDLIIGATGRKSIGRAEILDLKNNAVLASASSKRVEIDIEELESLCIERNPTEIGTYYELANGNKVLLLANGFPINFFSSESVPDRIIDVILTLMFSNVISLAKGEIYLFSISANFKRELENKRISEDLKIIFEENECRLPSNAKISIINGKEWIIKNEKERYIVRESNNQLLVYEESKSKIYKCSSNEDEIAELFHEIHF